MERRRKTPNRADEREEVLRNRFFEKNLLTNEATGDNIYKLSARNASGAILENDTENEKQENSRFGKS